jgi:acetyl-CoA acetyltransferase
MRDAYIVGAGQSPYGAFPEESYRSLFRTAFEESVESVPAGIDADAIDEAFVGTLGVGGRQIGLSGPAVTEYVGLQGVSCTRVENACAASGERHRAEGFQVIDMADAVPSPVARDATDSGGTGIYQASYVGV